MRYLNRAFAIFFFFSAVVFIAPHIALGASATISATPQADGSVVATATGSFASCPVCDAVDANGVCIRSHTVNSGSISLFQDRGAFLCLASGNGAASCTKVEDRGGLNGTHVFSATASDCAGSGSSSYTLTLDNTPTVTVTGPTGVISGTFDVTGTATFKPTLSATKGYIYAEVNGGFIHFKACLTEICSFSYKDLAGKLYEMGHGGPYTVRLDASGGGSWASDQKTFSVDNTPTVTVTGPTGVISGTFDVTGTATFKPTLNATKGTITATINGFFLAQKNCTTENCSFSYQQLTGNLYSLPPGGPYTVRLVARGGGATASDQKTFEVATCRDNDGDGFFGYDPVSCPKGNDCNDNDAAVNPDAKEQCNGLDENCNSDIDESACQCSLELGGYSSLNLSSGNLAHSQELFSTKGTGLTSKLSLDYNSLDAHTGPLGLGWVHSYDITLRETSTGSVVLTPGSGQRRLFDKTVGGYVSQAADYSTLTREVSGWKLVEKSGVTSQFNHEGKITSVADRNGNTMNFTYTLGLLSAAIDSAGRTTSFTYDAQSRISAISDPSGNSHMFSYTNGSLTSVVTQDSLLGQQSWVYTYDLSGFLLTKTDPNRNTTTYAYDANARLAAATSPEGKLRTLSYSPTTSTTQVRESDGGIWTYRYDTVIGVLIQKSDPQGNTTLYTYDTQKNLISRQDPDGAITRYSYDAQGNMVSVTDPLGQRTVYSYNSFGQITSTTSPQGDVTIQTYDVKGNLISTTDPSGAVTSLEYDAKGNITRLTDAQSRITTFGYDSQGNLVFITDPAGATTTFTYDSAGNMLSQTDAQGNITRFEYNSLSQFIKVIDPSGNATVYDYDANGNRVTQTDANGNITDYAYNSKGQLTAVRDALEQITTYAYDGAGCPSCGGGGNSLTEVTDANGRVTHYHYDTSGRLVQEADPLGNRLSYAYDAKGNLIAKTDGNGATTQYTYDALGRLIKKSYPDNTSENFTYDAKGNILTAANPHIGYTLSYDSNSRLTQVVDSTGATINYQYDLLGNKTRTTYPDNSVVTYGYDAAGRLASLTHAGRTFTYQYDSLGRRIKLTLPNRATTGYAYDRSGKLTSLTHRNAAGSVIQSFAYSHDKVGNRLSKTELDRKHSYNYDKLYRLLGSQPTKLKGKDQEQEHKAEVFSYDPVGNRVTGPGSKDAYSYNVGNQLISDRKHQYQYDNNGNLIKKVEVDDGEVETTTLYTYDFENRLIGVQIHKGDKTTLVTFTYDPFGRRLSKTVHRHEIDDDDDEDEAEDDETESPRTIFYIYDNEDIILEYNQRGEITARYTHGLGIDEPLAVEKKKEIYFYHADGLGSVVALTDSKQKVVESYDYDSFGNPKRKGDKVKNSYTFTGREWDKEIGLYYYRARYYDSNVGRFTRFDPIWRGVRQSNGNSCRQSVDTFSNQDSRELNPYIYVMNNPINFTDPEGLQALGCLRCIMTIPQFSKMLDACAKERDRCKTLEDQLRYMDKYNAGYMGEATLNCVTQNINDPALLKNLVSRCSDCVDFARPRRIR